MAAINDISLKGVESKDEAVLREILRTLLWQWIEQHSQDRVRLHIWIFRKDFKIEELYGVFELILGKRPVFVP